MAPAAVPLMMRIEQNLSRLYAVDPALKVRYAETEAQNLTTLSLFGDKDATNRLEVMVSSPDPTESLRGQIGQLNIRWYSAGRSADSEAIVIDDLEKLAKAHPDSQRLTMMTERFYGTAVTPELKVRLKSLITDKMKNPEADNFSGRFSKDK